MEDPFDTGIDLEPLPESLPRLKWHNPVYDSFANPIRTIRKAYTDSDLATFITAIALLSIIIILFCVIAIIIDPFTNPEHYNMNEGIGLSISMVAFILMASVLAPVFAICLFQLLTLLDFMVIFFFGSVIPTLINILTRKGKIIKWFDVVIEPPPGKVMCALLTASVPAMLIFTVLFLPFSIIMKIFNLNVMVNESLVLNYGSIIFKNLYTAIYTAWLFFAFRAYGLKIWPSILSLIAILPINLYITNKFLAFLAVIFKD
jgi:hypothetical protein